MDEDKAIDIFMHDPVIWYRLNQLKIADVIKQIIIEIRRKNND